MKWASRGSFPFMKMLYPRKIDEVLWALRHLPVREINLGKDAKAADDPGAGGPIQLGPS
jgi:hypothetical protein